MLSKIGFWFVALNALAGAGSLLLFPTRTDTLFFWEIRPPLNAALFGALYLGGAIIVGWVTYQGRWEPARFLVPILVSAGALIAITTLLHLDRFAPGVRLAYWLVVYIGAPLLAVLFYVQHERRGANWTVIEPVAPATRTTAIGVGGLLVVAGVAILIWPAAVVARWPWPISPLMLRIFASWFSAFGVGMLCFIVERDWRRLHLIPTMLTAAAVFDLVMLFVHRGDLVATDWRLWAYCAHLLLLGGVGQLMHGLQRAATRRRALAPA